jgi:thermitase
LKPHIIIKLHRPLPHSLPYWEEVLTDKRQAPTSLLPEVDRLMAQHHLPFWATQNYPSRQKGWTPSEIKNGFPRIYRLVLQYDRYISPRLLTAIEAIPEVESGRSGQIAQIPLPEPQLAQATALSSPYRQNTMRLREAHQYTKGHPGISIAVLDTGFELSHPEIRQALLPGKDFVNIIDGTKQFIGDHLEYDDYPEDEVGHGTHVAGILAGRGIKMPIGVAPRCKILPVKVLGALQRNGSLVGAGLVDNIDNGIKWAVDQGASIINMSLGLRQSGGGLPHREVIRYALAKGVTIIAASGNDGRQERYYPGALPGVIAVGAADDRGHPAPFSTFGDHISVLAPGVNIYSSFLRQGYTASSGTSQSTPFVAGAIALLKAFALKLGKPLADRQIKYILKNTADKISPRFKDLRAGFGNLNVLDAIKLLQYLLNKNQSYAGSRNAR